MTYALSIKFRSLINREVEGVVTIKDVIDRFGILVAGEGLEHEMEMTP